MKKFDVLLNEKTNIKWIVMNCVNPNNVELLKLDYSSKIKSCTVFVNQEELKDFVVEKV